MNTFELKDIFCILTAIITGSIGFIAGFCMSFAIICYSGYSAILNFTPDNDISTAIKLFLLFIFGKLFMAICSFGGAVICMYPPIKYMLKKR